MAGHARSIRVDGRTDVKRGRFTVRRTAAMWSEPTALPLYRSTQATTAEMQRTPLHKN